MKSLVYLVHDLGRGGRGGWAEWVHARPDFGRMERAARQLRHVALLQANPDFQALRHP